MSVEIRVMTLEDVERVSALADRLVGHAYYTHEIVTETMEKSTLDGRVFSYVATQEDDLVAFRFVLPPGRWEHGRGEGLAPSRWKAPMEKTAYFQSCFVDHSVMGQGIGRELAHRALHDLKNQGALAVVAHSWKESPHQSSLRYLTRLGFEPVAEHPEYWVDVDYTCSLDGKPCHCTAIEVVLDLTHWAPPEVPS
jgi:L-amino acid N-acyltransferase YncA